MEDRAPAQAGPRWVPWALFALAGAVYALCAWDRLAGPSDAPHFLYLAQSWLHGRLDLLSDRPPSWNDWARYGGRYYVSFPPLPALLMLPGVAIWGLRFNDVIFTLIFAAANPALFYLVLRTLAGRGHTARRWWEDAGLALVLAFGTVHFFSSVGGQVWYTALILGVMWQILYLWAALDGRHPWRAGLALGLGMATRTPLAFTFPVFLWEAWRTRQPKAAGRRRLAGQLVRFAVPVVIVGGLLAAHNYARFERPFEFGHSYLYRNRVTPTIQKHGLFDYRYLERNLHAALTRLPEWNDTSGVLTYSGHGMSLLLTTPLFLWLLWPRRRAPQAPGLWAGLAAAALPGLFYMNTGWYQFGYRFSLDWTVLALTLLALGGRRFGWAFWLAAAAGMGVNTWGALVFNR